MDMVYSLEVLITNIFLANDKKFLAKLLTVGSMFDMFMVDCQKIDCKAPQLIWNLSRKSSIVFESDWKRQAMKVLLSKCLLVVYTLCIIQMRGEKSWSDIVERSFIGGNILMSWK